MEEFMLIFRHQDGKAVASPEQIQIWMKQTMDWIGGIAAQGKFSSANQLGFQGKTLKADGIITDGPYAEVKEIVGGYIIVKAESLDAAVALAHGCPILAVGGHVEVRDIMGRNV